LIRKYEARDAEAAFTLAKDSLESAQWSLQSYRELGSAGEWVWVAEAREHVTGFLVAREMAGEAEILNVVVDKAHRRAGLGRSLLQTARSEFLRVGVSRVFLEVRESNRGALEFYENYGFVRKGFRKGYYHEPVEGAVLMEMKLTG